jgi:glutamate decarboxylase
MSAAGLRQGRYLRRPARPEGEVRMTLHRRETVRDQLDDSVFANHDLANAAPKYRFPNDEWRPVDAFQVVSDQIMLDGNSRQNLATFCQTWEEPEVHRLMDLSLDKNMIDKDEYPQTAEVEKRCVHMLADLWNAPDSVDTVGCSTIGSSEACMLGGMAAKWRWREKRRAAGLSTDNPNMVCGPVQVVWHKFAKYWDIEMREVPMSHGHYAMTPEDVLARVDENTIMVVPTLGLTYTGTYEMVKPIADALDKLQADTGLDVDIHVDGASGAFLAPFCAPEIEWDFRLPRVKSISTSGHKFGLAPLGTGWVVWSDKAELPDDLIFHVNYLGGDMPVFQINFSRPAGQIVAQYYDFLRLGKEGYRRVHMASYEIGRYLAEEVVKIGPFELLCDSNPKTGIPTVTWRITEGVDPGYTLFDVADRLRIRGWQVPAYTLTGSASDIPVQRILVRQGVSRDLAEVLLDDFRDAVAHFAKHPIVKPMTKEESTGFNHL